MSDYILEMKNIVKTFPGVKALSNVDFKVIKGHVHALVGENGAGKSTLIKIISGVHRHGNYEGNIICNGNELKFTSISDVEKAGIACIHQELNVVPEMSVSENIFLNEKPTRFCFIDFEKMYVDTIELLKLIGMNTDTNITISPDEKIKNLGIGQKQMVEIAKALSKNVKIMIMDEPTAALTEAEVDILLGIVETLREKGVSVIYISHRLDEVMRIADEITVLRDGHTIETRERSEMDKDTMISLMVGRELTNMFPRVPHKRGEMVFEVKNYSVANPDVPGKLLIDNVSFKAYKGEILGFSGLMGAGRTELFSAIFGAFREKGEGDVFINGKKMNIEGPVDSLKNGLVVLSEDRKKMGLNLLMNIKENTTLAALHKVSNIGMLNDDKEVFYTKDYMDRIRIAAPNIDVKVSTLSGGNQQKVVIAKGLFCDPKVIIMDEPTRGIDVGAKYEIYKLMNNLVDDGVVIIMISSEMEEILGMSDRILTMANGRITAEFDINEATQEKLLKSSVPGPGGN
jgi:D-xylose transport system ATP-binding protein